MVSGGLGCSLSGFITGIKVNKGTADMGYNLIQFRKFVDKTTTEIGLYSLNSTDQLLGTAAKESEFGTYLYQLGSGPALGAYQMEPNTFSDLLKRYGERFRVIRDFHVSQLEYDLRVSTIMARIKYFSCPGPIPTTLLGRAEYWKKYYNTPAGLGTVAEYLNAYKRHVG
jgi:hypothetical protein